MIAKVRRRAISWAGVMAEPANQQAAGGEGKSLIVRESERATAYFDVFLELGRWKPFKNSDEMPKKDQTSSNPMVIVLSLFAFVYLVGLLTLAGALWRAPEGFEDDEGFHAGQGH